MEKDHSFEHCMKCTVCNDYCPVLKVSPSFPGPKRLGPDGERYRRVSAAYYDEQMKYCLNCKRCELACPSDVKIADIILNAKLEYGGRSHVLRNAALSHTDFVGFFGTRFAPVANAAASMMFHRGPRYACRSFEKLFESKCRDSQDSFSEQLSYFHGCYVNYNNPSLGLDFVKVMNSMGVGVRLLDSEKCCGIALISNGFKRRAEKQAQSNLAAIRAAASEGMKVVGTSTTCIFTMRDEYNHILGLDVSDVRDSLTTATKYIIDRLDAGKPGFRFRKDLPELRIAYHVPCHLEKLGWSMYTIRLLQMIPGVKLTVLDDSCCGVAGTYGFKSENRGISKKIGSTLFQQIEQSGADYVVTDCETCRWQIEMNTDAVVLHPITLLAQSIE